MGDIPLVGDWDGDGLTDYAVFRPSTATWYIWQSQRQSLITYPFGAVGDIPLVGDWDGDGFTDYAVFRPSTATWYIWQSRWQSLVTYPFGTLGDIPISVRVPAATITGQVLAGGSGLTGATVTLSGSTSSTTTTDTNGNYSFMVPTAGSYTVTPSLSGYTFSPASKAFSSLSGNQTGNFSVLNTGSPGSGWSQYLVTGQVLGGGFGLGGVTVTLTGSGVSATTTTDDDGRYTLNTPNTGSFTLTPALLGYTFSPASALLSSASTNQTAPTFNISGTGVSQGSCPAY
ncbi:MAG: carboxypeptidase-like regulatory domain-containing protein [Acidobacteriaceae bacterium]|nr:carboxypeptidase-like regulatory domain-containing protein [Acidobacteriaceae bacterium]MBV9502527.1 carboxypeptidase-like regulatory domain-containing protein [Acidobacteriaceae bacterium]